MTSGFTRRSILKSIVVVSAASAGSGLLSACSDDSNGGGELQSGERYFPQSVASGDPKPNSVVLWVRGVNPDRKEDLSLRLEVSKSNTFDQLVVDAQGLQALQQHDGCLRVRVENLEPRTTYYYRFTHERDGVRYATVAGRTRTAPAEGSDTPVRFAVANCQDYIGRYYNAYQRLLQLDTDLDFVLCVGDYVYETSGDPSFQSGGAASRRITFSEPVGAIPVGSGASAYLAASTLSNYRDLYRTYRSDKVLQKVHELYPFIVIWDDHEFADDSWGATATYFDGLKDETDAERRGNAEQAFFEYLPIDTGTAGNGGALETTRDQLYPNTKLWRRFGFGKHLDLVITDYRSYRPDHLIPEEAFPGTVVMDQATLNAVAPGLVGTLPAATFAYVDIDEPQYANQKALVAQAVEGLFTAAYQKAGLIGQEARAKAQAAVKGKLALQYVNGVLAQLGQAPIDPSGKEKGVAYVHFAKLNAFSDVGSRYFAVKPLYDLYAGYLYARTQGKSENVLGAEQQAWLYEQLGNTASTWRAVVSSVSLTSMPLDLSQKTDLGLDLLKQNFYFDVDQWDGFPNRRAELLGQLKAKGAQNTLFLSGDIHAAFVSKIDAAKSNMALTAPAITSAPIRTLIGNAVQNTGLPTGKGTPFYGYVVTGLDQTLRDSNPDIVYTNTDHHGFVLVELGAQEAKATFHLIPEAEVGTDYSTREGELAAKFTTQVFTFPNTRTA
ncbi:metallophosphatase [Aggregicoccus sp. 17bor-14]|uniref:alkaline phosphatase D family protein n=1 Tax=Myxococcaceae TaxID=31 RepID=UPI00129C4D55|nr:MULTISPECIES: alkaline phosphatase D family protein [Myxococcaceae]MBF5046461.1 alkaline phosphatase D family protein [Simulacricoccus sp. 17bor-14]MRI92179.1 metallophosphatase [Aggregicoccus sp. 17bor-14]